MENEDEPPRRALTPEQLRQSFTPEQLRKKAEEGWPAAVERHHERYRGAPERIFAQRLRGCRDELGMTQQQVADRMTRQGFSMKQTTIAKIEAGQRPVRINEAVALANILGLQLVDLVGDPVASGEVAELDAERRRLVREIIEFEGQVNSLRAAHATTQVQLMEAAERLRQLRQEEYKVSRSLLVARQKARGERPPPPDEDQADDDY